MQENNDTNAGGLTDDEETASAHDNSPTPIFVSFVYDFVKMDPDLGGEGGGRPGTLGGTINEKDPKYKVYTYQYLPPVGENIQEK